MLLGLHSRKGPVWLGPDDFSTAVTSLGCVLRVDLGETPVKSPQAHKASDLTPVEFSRTAVISLGCALRVDLGETPVKSHQAHEASDLTPVEFSRT